MPQVEKELKTEEPAELEKPAHQAGPSAMVIFGATGDLTAGKLDSDLRDWMLSRVYYIGGDFKDPQVYAKLAQTLAEADKNHHTHGNYFFYLATSPLFFGDIVEQLGA